jgi:rhodanese-related sulfurtransferase
MTRFVLLFLVACSETAPLEAAPPTAGEAAPAVETVQNRDVAALAAALPGAPFLIDVRTADEYASGHVPGARNIPLDQLESRLSELEPHRGDDVWVVCHSGSRSARASRLLASAGFRTINVEGGTSAWIAAGHPTE